MPLHDKHLSILWPLFPVLIAISFWFGVKAGGDNLLKDKKTALSGMGSLERAGNLEQAQWIIQSWNKRVPDSRPQNEIEHQRWISSVLSNDGRLLTEVAKRSLVFDLFFIFFYSTSMAVACLLAAAEIAVRRPKENSHLVAIGIRLAYLQILTASVDVMEDFALWRMLSGSTFRFWPWIAFTCSVGKYILLAISLSYVCIAFVFWVVDHKRRRSRMRAARATP